MWELRSLVRMYLWNHWFSKIPPKNLIDFCPARFNISKYLVHRIFLSRNRIKFFVGILENRWFHKTFSYYLTFNQDVQLLNFCPLSDWYYPRLATAHDFIVTCSNFKILEILLRGLLSAAPSSYVQYVHRVTSEVAVSFLPEIVAQIWLDPPRGF